MKRIIPSLACHSLFRPASVGLIFLVLGSGQVWAQAQDDTGIKRAFLDRYLDCAEAPGDVARLACYDQLLIDIPAWLEDANDPPRGIVPTQAHGKAHHGRIRIDCPTDTSAD